MSRAHVNGGRRDREWLLGMTAEERRAERFTERGNGIAPWIVAAVREQDGGLSDMTVAQRIGVDARLVARVRAAGPRKDAA